MNANRKNFSMIGFLLFAIFFGMTLTAEGKTIEVDCQWAAGPPEVDGSIDEWEGIPTIFFEDEKLVLSISSDSSNLYMYLRTDNPRLVRTIRGSGLQLWLDAKGKKKKDLGFLYRGGPSMDETRKAGLIDRENTGHRSRGGRASRLEGMPENRGTGITLIDKYLDLEEKIPADGSQGPEVKYSFDKGFCIFEIAIPLQEHLIDYYGMNAQPGQEISIGIKYGGRPDRGGDMGGFFGGTGGGPGGRGQRAGGIGSRSGGPGGRGSMQLPEKKEFWIKTRLAVSAEDQ
jgi:hypothetical protein